MPRKKKRRPSQDRLHPLDFEESPRNICHTQPSPVFASDNPATAQVIPADHELTHHWVSPQFPQHTAEQSHRRQGHSRCSGNKTGLLTTDKSVTSALHHRKHAKYGALLFIDEVSNETANSDKDNGIRRVHPEMPNQEEESGCTTSDASQMMKFTPTRKKHKSKRVKKKLHQIDFDSDDGDECQNATPLRTPVTRTQRNLLKTDTGINTAEPAGPRNCPVEPVCYSDIHTPEPNKITKSPRHLFTRLFTSPHTLESRPAKNRKILVYDTPEDEYGIGKRLRSRRIQVRNLCQMQPLSSR